MCEIILGNGNAIHEYDFNAWRGELAALREAREILLGTEVPDVVFEEIDRGIEELTGYLQYGANADGTGPDYPDKK
jgi:hypothetical protein